MKITSSTRATPRDDRPAPTPPDTTRHRRAAVPDARPAWGTPIDLDTGELVPRPSSAGEQLVREFENFGKQVGDFFNAAGSAAKDFFSRVGAGDEDALATLFNYTGNLGQAIIGRQVDTINAAATRRGPAPQRQAPARGADGRGAPPEKVSAGLAHPRGGVTSALDGSRSLRMEPVRPPPPGVKNFAEEFLIPEGGGVVMRADDGYTNNFRGKGHEAIVLHGQATRTGQGSYLVYQRGQQRALYPADGGPPEILEPFREQALVSARQLVEKIRKNHEIDLVAPSRGGQGQDGPLYLLACHATRGGCRSAAQDMANYTGREVRAYSKYMIAAANPSAVHGNPAATVDIVTGTQAQPGAMLMPARERALLRARNLLAGHGPSLRVSHQRFQPQPGSRTERPPVVPTAAPPPSLASSQAASTSGGGSLSVAVDSSQLGAASSVPSLWSGYSSVQFHSPPTYPLVSTPAPWASAAMEMPPEPSAPAILPANASYTSVHRDPSPPPTDRHGDASPASSAHRFPGAPSPVSSTDSRPDWLASTRTSPSSVHRLSGGPSSISSNTGSFTPSPPDSP